jgi:large subunit ribosomal protein L13
MIIDATNLIVGRLASFSAKKALLGEDIIIVNVEKAILTGARQSILLSYRERKARMAPAKGPFIHRYPERFVKRIIRGMLPHKRERGVKAYKRITCYMGVPDNLKDQKFETIASANVSKLQNLKYITIKELCKAMGAPI